jgi:hypothetical protein
MPSPDSSAKRLTSWAWGQIERRSTSRAWLPSSAAIATASWCIYLRIAASYTVDLPAGGVAGAVL